MRAALAGAIVGLFVPFLLPAQVARLQVVDTVAGQPVPGAIVTVMTAGGDTVRSSLTDGNGRVSITLPAPGAFQVIVRRIGYSRTSVRFELAEGQRAVARTIHVHNMPVVLAATAVRQTARCVPRNAESDGLSVVWEEIAKALTAQALSANIAGVRLEGRIYEQTLDRNLRVQTADTSHPRVTRGVPFVSRSAAYLSRYGYVIGEETGDRTFFAPDGDVLLSEEFARDHCFGVVRSGEGEDARVGLAFEPVPQRSLPDIAGVFWVAAETWELRTIEFRYVNVDWPRTVQHAGGKLEFTRLSNGRWIIHDWVLTLPRFLGGTPDPNFRHRALGQHVGYIATGGFLTGIGDRARTSDEVGTGAVRGEPVHGDRPPGR